MIPSVFTNYSLPDAVTAAALSSFAYRYGEPGVNFTQLLNSNGWNVIATKAAPGLPGRSVGTHQALLMYEMCEPTIFKSFLPAISKATP